MVDLKRPELRGRGEHADVSIPFPSGMPRGRDQYAEHLVAPIRSAHQPGLKQYLPFPYSGVDGVLTPRYKSPPTRTNQNDILDYKQVRYRSGIAPVTPALLFVKDGCDMNLQCLETDVYRMESAAKELGRAVDVKKLQRDVRDLIHNRHVPPAISHRLLDIEKAVQEKQRLKEELEWGKRVEVERQFWIERDNRNRYFRELYAPSEQDNSLHPNLLYQAKCDARREYLEKGVFKSLRQSRANFNMECARILVTLAPTEKKTFANLCGVYEWMGTYGTEKHGIVFLKQDEKLRIQYESGQWVIKDDETVLCRSDDSAESPTDVVWTKPDLHVVYASGDAEAYGPEVANIGSAYGRPLPSSEGHLKTTLAEYEDARKQGATHYTIEVQPAPRETETRSPTRGTEPTICYVINTCPAEISAEEACEIDAVQPVADGFLRSAFDYCAGGLWQSEDDAETKAILAKENVVSSYIALDNPDARGKYEFDPAAFWEKFEAKKLRQDSVYDASVLYKKLVALHREGRLGLHGGQDIAQTVFEFLWASSTEKVSGSEGLRRIGFISDILHKYPYHAFPITYWAIESMVALYNQQDPAYRQQLACPMLDICSYIARVTYDAPCFAVHTRLLAALAVCASDCVTGTHMVFVLRRYSERARSKGRFLTLSIEYILQFLTNARSTCLLRSQIDLLMEVMEAFKFDPKLVVRSLLCCASLYELGKSAEDCKKLQVKDNGHIRNVVELCDFYPDDRKVQGAGCKALLAICGQGDVRSVVQGGLQAILHAGKRFPQSNSVATSVCQLYYCIAQTAPELVSEDLFQVSASLMRSVDPQIVQLCVDAMRSSSTLVSRAMLTEVESGCQWEAQTLRQIVRVAERLLCDYPGSEAILESLLQLLCTLAQDARLFIDGSNEVATLCMKTLGCEVIPLALEVFNRVHCDQDTLRRLQCLQRIADVFARAPEKSLNANQTRWLMLTMGNIALRDAHSVEDFWRETSPRKLWATAKMAVARGNVEDIDVVAQTSRAMSLLLNVPDPLERD